MTEIEKLTALRDKLVAKRRGLVESFQDVDIGQLSGESIARIQSAIEAIDRAIEDETRVASAPDASRSRRVQSAPTWSFLPAN